MTAFWVVGGEYESTRFERIAGGGREERHGPYASYDEAEREWARLSWARVDNCNVRYRIVEERDAAA